MAEDWLADVRKYASGADENVVGSIVKYLGIALRTRDSSLVSFSDPVEVGRVRDNFLRKKLALPQSEDELNGGLDWVKGVMTGDRTKNRVTVYYLLAHYFGKLDLFGGPAGTSAASLLGGGAATGAATLAGIGAAGAVASIGAEAPQPAEPQAAVAMPPVPETVSTRAPAPVAAVSAASATGASPSGAAAGGVNSPVHPSYAAGFDDERGERTGWPRWLTWLLIALAVVALILFLRSCMAEKPMATDQSVTSEVAPPAAGENGSDAAAGAQATGDGVAMAVPTGAGVLSGMKDSKPLLTVYFDSGKAAVSKDLAAAAATLKSYLGAHPGARLAVSGYNDPTGNAALNAELSKKRAQAVAAALASAGIPGASIDLVKPGETTTASVTPEQARRVEVTIQ